MREGLANAARHAQASAVTVRVHVVGAGSQGSVRVEVEDDGVGLPPDRPPQLGHPEPRANARASTAGPFRSARAPTARARCSTWEAPLG